MQKPFTPFPQFPVTRLAWALSLAVSGLPAVALAAEDAVKAAELTEVVVRGTPLPSYSVLSTFAGSRTETPLEHIPQSIVVLPRAVMQDQGAATLSDALRNVSNVNAVDERDSNLAGFRVRGFSAATIEDGVAAPGIFQNQTSLANVDQIGVIKGPSGGLYGGSQGMNYSTIGGAVVVTTAEPVAKPLRQVSAGFGSYDHRQAGFDFNQALGDRAAFRLVGEYSDKESETDRVYFKRTGLFPSFSFTPGKDSKLVLRLKQTHNATLDYPGLPRANAASPDVISGVSRSRFIGAEGMPETTNETQGVNLQWSQKLNERWDFNFTVAHNQLELNEYGAFNASVIDAYLALFAIPAAFGSATQDIYAYRLGQKFSSNILSPSLIGKFETGEMKHLLSLGVDYEKSREDGLLYFSDPAGVGLSPIAGTAYLGGVGVDLTSANYPAWIMPAGNSGFDSTYQRHFTASTAFVQDQADVGNWHLLGALRVNDIEMRQGAARYSSAKVTPRLGAVYDFTPRVSAFLGYGEAVKTPSSTTYAAGVTPKPEEVTQTELGLRLKDLAGVTASVALFELNRKNVATASAAIQNYQADQVSKGLELDLRWQVNSAWQWLAAYTRQKVEYSGTEHAAIANVVGKQIFNVPEQSLRLATRYDIRKGDLAGLGLGLGLTQHARLPGNAANDYFTPAATVWDAQVSYRIKSARLGLNITNLMDKEYLIPSAYFGGGQITPAPRRTVTASARIDF